jgi:rubrerythrin
MIITENFEKYGSIQNKRKEEYVKIYKSSYKNKKKIQKLTQRQLEMNRNKAAERYLQKKEEINSRRNVEWECDVCNITMKSKTNKTHHIRTLKHQKNLKKKIFKE